MATILMSSRLCQQPNHSCMQSQQKSNQEYQLTFFFFSFRCHYFRGTAFTPLFLCSSSNDQLIVGISRFRFEKAFSEIEQASGIGIIENVFRHSIHRLVCQFLAKLRQFWAKLCQNWAKLCLFWDRLIILFKTNVDKYKSQIIENCFTAMVVKSIQ